MSSMWILVAMVFLLFLIIYFAIQSANKLPKGKYSKR